MTKRKEVKRILWKSLKITSIFIGVTSIGFFSNIDQLFGHNFYESFISPYFPHSIIYLLMSCLLLYLIELSTRLFRYVLNITPTASDIATLEKISSAYPLDDFYEFKEYLATNRAVIISQIDSYESSALRLLDNDMRISNQSIEKSKNVFGSLSNVVK